jgi:hypothetical protein
MLAAIGEIQAYLLLRRHDCFDLYRIRYDRGSRSSQKSSDCDQHCYVPYVIFHVSVLPAITAQKAVPLRLTCK